MDGQVLVDTGGSWAVIYHVQNIFFYGYNKINPQ